MSDSTGIDGGQARAEITHDFHEAPGVSRLVRVLDEYLSAARAGQPPDAAKLLEENPDIADELKACLAGIDFIHRADPAGSLPRRLGDFEIVREVGRGGMGAVYEARQVSLDRRVALKVLRFAAVSDPQLLERFRREAETVAQLHHTNIVPVFSIGQEAGVNYYAMQYIDGQSLADVLRESGEPPRAATVAEWGLQVAEALAYAHQHGVIHRDIKPSNVLVDGEGRVWLTDFGLARRLTDVTLSVTGALLGTPRYMSPEQATATERRIDHRTDIYSLGATLYEMATGKPVFEGTSPQGVLAQILEQEPRPPRELRRGLPRDLETIILKCLHKDPARRYASARELAEDLRAFLEDRPIRARRPSAVERASRWTRKHRRSVTLAAAAAAVTLAVALAAWAVSQGYGRWQLGTIRLSTDQAPLAARLVSSGEQPLGEPFTVPMQAPREFPAGAYRLDLSGEGRFSQTYRTSVRRGEHLEYDIDLEDQLAGKELELDRSFALADLDGRTDVIHLSDAGVSRLAGGDGHTVWSLDLGKLSGRLEGDAPGFRWPWTPKSQFSSQSGRGKFDLRPQIVRRAPDLDGDGVGDLVLAARHQAWMLALSGAQPKVLWCAGREPRLGGGAAKTQGRSSRVYLSAAGSVLGAPAVVDDLDGDKTPDLVATWGLVEDAGLGSAPGKGKFWIEAISGATGRTVWRYDLPAEWFQLPNGQEPPYALRWFTGESHGTRTSGGGFHTSGDYLVRNPDWFAERTGPYLFAPEPARPVAHGGIPAVACVAGARAVVLRLKDGSPSVPPLDLGTPLLRPPVWRDLDGDGNHELISLHGAVAPAGGMPGVRLCAWSLKHRQKLWERALQAVWPGQADWAVQPPDWPMAADLDADGRAEVLVPNGSSRKGLAYRDAPWGVLEVLDGSTGAPRWSRKLHTVDQQIDRWLIGPDLDGDGRREVFVARLVGYDLRLCVEAVSGNDGSTWWLSEVEPESPLVSRERLWLSSPFWWGAGTDGWPQLVVTLAANTRVYGQSQAQAYVFSAGTGKHVASAKGLELHSGDADGDGAADLLGFRTRDGSLDGGGRLAVVAGGTNERWRWLGPLWKPAADYDGDGQTDLVAVSGALVETISAATGNVLWTSDIGQQSRARPALVDADLDGDGVADLVLAAEEYFHARPERPLVAMSGLTGRTLWTAELAVTRVEKSLLVEAADLDRDGNAEILYLASTSWGYPEGFIPGPHQLWLAVLSGRSGKVRWTHPLGKPYHKPDTPWAGQTRQFAVDQTAPGVALADLDRDSVADIVAVAEAEDPATSPVMELRAVRGTDGGLLWRCPLPAAMTGDVYGLYRNAPVPVAADLDGDGHAEIVFLEFENVPERGGIQRFARVRALDGGSGKPLWSHQTPVSINAGNVAANHLAQLMRPMATVLRVAQSPHPHIAVNLWGRPCEILVLDHAGKPVARYPAKAQADEFRFWAADCDGDGGDEIVMLRDRKLQAFRPESPERPLWTADVPATWGPQILGIHGEQPVPRVVYRNERRVYGIDGATGAVVWTCDGPRPVHQQALLMVDASVLDARAAAPNVLFSYNFVSAFRQAVRAGRSDLPEARVPPRLDGAAREPRLTRRLPWATDGRVFVRRELYLFGWASFYAITLLVVPALWIGWLVWRRRWSLRAMLMFPLIVLLILPGGLVEGPNPPFPQYSDSLGGRMTSGMFVMPLLFVPAYSAFLAYRRRWRALAVWLAVFAAVCGLAAAVAVYVDSSRASEITVYSWEGWYWIALPGIYITGCVMLFWTALLLVIRAARGLVRRFRGRRPWPTPANAT